MWGSLHAFYSLLLCWLGGEIIKSFIHIYKKKAPTNILRVFLYKSCVKTIPLVAQILGNSFKEKTRIKLEGCWMMMVGDQTNVSWSRLDLAILFSVTSHGLQLYFSILSRWILVVKPTSMFHVLLWQWCTSLLAVLWFGTSSVLINSPHTFPLPHQCFSHSYSLAAQFGRFCCISLRVSSARIGD